MQEEETSRNAHYIQFPTCGNFPYFTATKVIFFSLSFTLILSFLLYHS